MVVSLGSNLFSLSTARQLNRSSDQLGRVFERLSSGQRFNRPSDDAASLAISSQLTNRSGILGQASLNVGNATSALSIADGALSQIGTLLSRLAELSGQAANGSLSSTQRGSLNQEFFALDKEIRRITSGTEFNGIELLRGQRSSNGIDAIASDVTATIGDVSADGRYVIFSTSATSGQVIYDSDTGNTTSLSSLTGLSGNATSASFTNDGKVYFTQNDGLASSSNVFSYDISSATTTQITDFTSSSNDVTVISKVSADGSALLLRTNADLAVGDANDTTVSNDASGNSIIVLDLQTGQVRSVAEDAAVGSTLQLNISADGNQIAFLSNQISGFSSTTNRAVYTADSSGSELSFNRVSTTDVNRQLRGVTNDGAAIYYESSTTSIFEADTSGVRTLVDDVTLSNNGFGVNVLGDAITFVSQSDVAGENPDGFYQIFQLDRISGEVRQLTDFTTDMDFDMGGYFSADGTTAYLVSELVPLGSREIQRLDITQDDQTFQFSLGAGDEGVINLEIGELLGELGNLGSLTITSQEAAQNALEKVNEMIDALSAYQGEIGAGLSRLESAGRLLSVQETEIEAANSRIRDIDVAEETASLVTLQIRTEVASSLLAQANQQPEIALQLLQNVSSSS
ncbi:flagellin [bacterium]|nr:flagellin [bacterium]